MTYATLDLLTNRVGEAMLIALTDRGEVPLGVVDTDVLGRALAGVGSRAQAAEALRRYEKTRMERFKAVAGGTPQ